MVGHHDDPFRRGETVDAQCIELPLGASHEAIVDHDEVRFRSDHVAGAHGSASGRAGEDFFDCGHAHGWNCPRGNSWYGDCRRVARHRERARWCLPILICSALSTISIAGDGRHASARKHARKEVAHEAHNGVEISFQQPMTAIEQTRLGVRQIGRGPRARLLCHFAP